MTALNTFGMDAAAPVVRGDTRRQRYTVTTDGTTAKDLTGLQAARYRLFDAPAGDPNATPLISELTLGNGITVIGDPAEGVIEVVYSTAGLSGVVYGELELTDAAGDVVTVAVDIGQFTPDHLV